MRINVALARRVALILGLSFPTFCNALADGRAVLPPRWMVDAYLSDAVVKPSRDDIARAIIPGLGMVPAFLGGVAGPTPSWVANGSPAGSANPSVPMPAGLAAGDLILLHVCAWGASPTISTPSGWTLVESTYHAFDSGNIRRSIFYKFAVGGDGSVAVTTSSNNASGITQSWSGVNASTPIEGATKTDSLGTSATAAYLTMTTTGPNRRVLQWFENVNAGLNTPKNGSPGTGWTERLDTLSPADNVFGIQVDEKEFATAGPTTGGTHSFSGSFAGGGASLIAFALCPK